MANEEHLKILKQGVEVWNRWREENPDVQPDLKGANLRGANLRRVDLWLANLWDADLWRADLWDADLRWARLEGVNLGEADLREAKLYDADLTGANFARANLTGTNFAGANLTGANLKGAKLDKVELGMANLTNADLTGANFAGAKVGVTAFAYLDLSVVKGLEAVEHNGPSTIGIDTIYRSGGKIPEAFLKGCGVPDNFITYIGSLTGEAIQFYSCFISYSSQDQEFADRLHADLQDKGVRCWFAPDDMRIGDKIRPAIDRAIRIHDKLMLILSKHSVASEWVESEVEAALEREQEQGETILFPVRLDDTAMELKTGWPALIKRTRHIGDFRCWKDHEAYQGAFERLLRDLKAEKRREQNAGRD